ncbi:hypothetical protein PV797_07425 [Clostridiaceae bacterium M8S5]|nr:hypothetical protein PV797_07425 [Clostridiaceae bacterium M8S5]
MKKLKLLIIVVIILSVGVTLIVLNKQKANDTIEVPKRAKLVYINENCDWGDV